MLVIIIQAAHDDNS